MSPVESDGLGASGTPNGPRAPHEPSLTSPSLTSPSLTSPSLGSEPEPGRDPDETKQLATEGLIGAATEPSESFAPTVPFEPVAGTRAFEPYEPLAATRSFEPHDAAGPRPIAGSAPEAARTVRQDPLFAPPPTRTGPRFARRSPDPTSIGAGIVFFLLGGAYLLASSGHLTVNAAWSVSLLFIGLGLAGLLGAALGARRRR